jgi:hypothetical protein
MTPGISEPIAPTLWASVEASVIEVQGNFQEEPFWSLSVGIGTPEP